MVSKATLASSLAFVVFRLDWVHASLAFMSNHGSKNQFFSSESMLKIYFFLLIPCSLFFSVCDHFVNLYVDLYIASSPLSI
jgi:hypothetical protein